MGRTTTTAGPFSSVPKCLGEPLGPHTVEPGGARLDASQFPREDYAPVTVTASALSGALSVTVDALAVAIPKDATVVLTGGKLARLSAAAAVGAVALTTYALPQALAGTETGAYQGTGKITIEVGTPVGRTYTERNAGTGFGPAASTDDEIFLVCVRVDDASDIDEVNLYRHGRIVYENFLPKVAQWAGALLTAVRNRYQMRIGA